MGECNGYSERKEALLANAEKNSPGICKDSRLYRKFHLFASYFSMLDFMDCLAQYDKENGSWSIHIWLEERKEVVFLFDDGNDFDMLVYVNGEYIFGDTYNDGEIRQIVSSWKKIIEKLKNREEIEEKKSVWHNFCSNIKEILNKIVWIRKREKI